MLSENREKKDKQKGKIKIKENRVDRFRSWRKPKTTWRIWGRRKMGRAENERQKRYRSWILMVSIFLGQDWKMYPQNDITKERVLQGNLAYPLREMKRQVSTGRNGISPKAKQSIWNPTTWPVILTQILEIFFSLKSPKLWNKNGKVNGCQDTNSYGRIPEEIWVVMNLL